MYRIMQEKLNARNKPLDVIVVGLGFMGFGFVSVSRTYNGLRIPIIITRRPQEAKKMLEKKGIKTSFSENLSAIRDFAKKGGITISNNLEFIKTYENEIVFDVTGSVDYGTDVAMKTFEGNKHLVTMNPELQATVGTELKKIADKKGLIITDVVGDQPGSLSRLIGNARMMGFKPLIAGNMKRYMDHHATQKKMQPWADDKGLNVRQTVSFTDGTKQSIEMTLVANYFGMKILQPGMKGPQIEDFREAIPAFKNEKIPPEGIVDYVIGRDLFPGVFVVVSHVDPNQKKYLRYLGLGDGPQYVLFEPYHLCHLEVAQTIAKVVLFHQETIHNTTSPLTQTIAVAKQDLKKGQKLDGIGGDTVYGMVDNTENSEGLLPIGFSYNAIVKNDILKDTPLTFQDVILPVNKATKLSGHVKTHSSAPFSFTHIFNRLGNLL